MQFACWFSSTSFVTMQFQQRCWYSYRLEAEMWFINNLIILFHHKRSTADAIKLYCCSIIAAANSVHFERIFGTEHGNFGKAVQPVPRFHVIIRALPFPEIIITGRVLYILRTLMTMMIHRGRASLDFRTTCWFVEFPQYGISNCSGSKIIRNRFNYIYICEYR